MAKNSYSLSGEGIIADVILAIAALFVLAAAGGAIEVMV